MNSNNKEVPSGTSSRTVGRKLNEQKMSSFTQEESYRDSIGTLQADGKRKWIYAKKPHGYYTNLRRALSLFLLALLFSMPFIRVGGHPFMLFNIIERKFFIFGQPFWPQDFYILALLFISAILFIAVFTILFGRIFCGWVCPQTIFMEFVYRQIEYIIEGDFNQQRALDAAPLSFNKVIRKTGKHIIFYAIAWVIGNTFLAYIIGTEKLWQIISAPPQENIGGFVAMIGFSFAFYFVFSRFREQACIIACPYGRLQGVLLGPKSIVVAYDPNRGEPRAPLRKTEPIRNEGDCISCNQCVYVCPTGIDIRNGTQLECVNCTACIDACDDIMDRVGFNRGLIRYTSKYSLQTGNKFSWSPRAIGYMAVLVILLTVSGFLIFSRPPVDATVLRLPGTMYQKQADDKITNLFQYKLVNKTLEEQSVYFSLQGVHATLKAQASQNKDSVFTKIGAQEIMQGILVVEMDRKYIQNISTPMYIQIWIHQNNGHDFETKRVKINFMGPFTN